MSNIFVLGSGFSKAVSSQMPVTRELRKHLSSRLNLGKHEHEKSLQQLLKDPELLLSYLVDPAPWKDEAQVHYDRGLFVQASREIGNIINGCQEKMMQEALPEWIGPLLSVWHSDRSLVATFNYDTIIERCMRKYLEDFCDDMVSVGDSIYPLPLASLTHRTHAGYSPETKASLSMLKLHGSTNWYFSGRVDDPGSTLYYDDVRTPSRGYDVKQRSPEEVRNRADLIPMIIPPVVQKGAFYGKHLVAHQWRILRKHWSAAKSIYFVGYSLPESDLTVRMFLKTALRQSKGRVFLVNPSEDLGERYTRVLDGQEIDTSFCGKDAVRRLTEALVEAKKEAVV